MSLRRLHAALPDGTPLEVDERLAAAVLALARSASTAVTRMPAGDRLPAPAAVRVAGRVCALLDEAFAEDLGATELAAAAGCSRYVVYRAFEAVHGLAPSDYQRERRLRTARSLLAAGRRPAEVAAEVGFADQAHLTRWFVRSFGVTPGAYACAARIGSARPVSQPVTSYAASVSSLPAPTPKRPLRLSRFPQLATSPPLSPRLGRPGS